MYKTILDLYVTQKGITRWYIFSSIKCRVTWTSSKSLWFRNRKTDSTEYSLANADSIPKTTNVHWYKSDFHVLLLNSLGSIEVIFQFGSNDLLVKIANASKIFDAIIMGQWYAIIRNKIPKQKWIGYF